MDKKKLGGRFWLSLVLFSLMGQVAWVVENMYLNVFIYKMFNASASDISAMVMASAVAATLTTVFVGALSDRVGKRKVFISLGYIFWGISILLFALLRVDLIESVLPAVSGAAVGVTLTIVIDCVMTFFGSSANDAAFNAWLTDATTDENRGSAEGINSMMPLVAILAVFGGFMAFDLEKQESWSAIFIIIGALTCVIGVLGFFIIEEKKPAPSNIGYFKSILYGFSPSTIAANKSLYLYILLFIIFNISIQIFMPYLIIYYEVSLGMADYVFVMAPAIMLASVATALWGKVYDKKGFSFAVLFPLLSLALGYIILFIFTSKALVFIGSLLMMCGYLCGGAVFGASLRRYTPEGKAGMLQGVRIFTQVLLPGVIGPAIGRAVLSDAKTIVNNDGTESFVPNANIFLAALVPVIILAVLLILFKEKKPPRLNFELASPSADERKGNEWNIHPDPQMRRDRYFSLCGQWKLSLKRGDEITELGGITVPFPPESKLSGIMRETREGDTLIYEKKFTLPADFRGEQYIIHFGAVDQNAKVSMNGNMAFDFKSGYLPFSIWAYWINEEGENIIKVEVIDPLDHKMGWGKQKHDRGGMWYTPISGIWKPVWIEAVDEIQHFDCIKLTPTLTDVLLETVGSDHNAEKKVTLDATGEEFVFQGDKVLISPKEKHLWTPEDPYLYYFTLTDGKDTIHSYFALRTFGTAEINGCEYLTLNGKPYFFHGLLDQGYYPEGIYTPATPKELYDDILRAKELGFNTLRKHIKIEQDIFYYYCDLLGMIVFQDFVNSGDYNFLIDTALPTVGIKKGLRRRWQEYREADMWREIEGTKKHLYNHPSVCYYTIFNEGWGQFGADYWYDICKKRDDTRIYDSTSGWFYEKNSDVKSEHVYFKKLRLKKSKKPLVLSEFGGYSYKIAEHSFNLDNTYGYGKFSSQEDFRKALLALYREQVIPEIKENGLCATIYTQLTDVEDETNGLYTYDRRVCKVDKKEMLTLAGELKAAFEERINGQG